MSAEGRARISFRDALANSPRFVETGDAEATDSKGNTSYFLKVMAISIDDNANKSGISTAIAETLLIGNSTYITTTIQVCGRETVVSSSPQPVCYRRSTRFLMQNNRRNDLSVELRNTYEHIPN